MLPLFFKALVRLWIGSDKYGKAVAESVAFLQWTHDLKAAAWLPARSRQDFSWKVKELKKTIRKMPELSFHFWVAINEIKDYPQNFPKSDWNLITQKKENINPLINWLRNISTQEDIEKLKAILIEAIPVSPDFKVKRNKRKQL